MASELIPVSHDLEFEATIRRLEITQQVFERYQLIRILGRGGMGVVWLARDERLDREVALKFLPDEISLDPEAEDEMKRETRRCLELTHANIIRIYDFVKDRQAAAISMEYIDGKTLSALKLEKPSRFFEIDELSPWITQTCQALQYAHEDVGIVHRDLKPGNLMLTSRGQIKIADFGIAQSVSDSMGRMTMRRGTSGTLAYMSPQQMSGERSRETDDVYALGATLYELLTSKPPFHSGNISFQVRVMIPAPIQERRDELEVRGSEVPKAWEETIAACLSKMPEDRPQSMREVAERLGLSFAPARLANVSVKEVAPAPGIKSSDPASKWRSVLTSMRERAVALGAESKSRKRILWSSGGLLGAILLAGVLKWHFSSAWAKPGEIAVQASPAGAMVQIVGGPSATAPVTIAGLAPGKYTVRVSADGYEPVECNVEIASGAKAALAPITLSRAYGSCAINTVPRHARYILEGGVGSTAFRKEGTSPDLISNVPAGSYQITVSDANFPHHSETVQVTPHSLLAENIDLIQLSVAGDRNDNAARAFRGETMTLDDAAKASLADLSRRAFQGYLASGFLDRAASELKRLKDLNVNVSDLQTALDLKRTSVETETASALAKLIKVRKFASAIDLLAGMATDLEPNSIARLKSTVNPFLDSYEQQIDASLKALSPADPNQAAMQLQKLIATYPDDPKPQLALAQVLTKLPPNHQLLSRQIEAFHLMASQHRPSMSDPAALKLMAAFEDESRKLDSFAKANDEAKSVLDAATAKINHLKNTKNDYEDRRIGKPKVDPFSSTLNFFGKVVTGHSVVGTEAVFSSRQEKEDAINSVESQIEMGEQSLPALQAAAGAAQAQYNQFFSAVPWN